METTIYSNFMTQLKIQSYKFYSINKKSETLIKLKNMKNSQNNRIYRIQKEK